MRYLTSFFSIIMMILAFIVQTELAVQWFEFAFQGFFTWYFFACAIIVKILSLSFFLYTKGALEGDIKEEDITDNIKTYLLRTAVKHDKDTRGFNNLIRIWLPIIIIASWMIVFEYIYLSIIFIGLSIFSLSFYNKFVEKTKTLYSNGFFDGVEI